MTDFNKKQFAGSPLKSYEIDLARNLIVGATSSDWSDSFAAWLALRLKHDRPEAWERCAAFWAHSSENVQAELAVELGWIDTGGSRRARTAYPEPVLSDFQELIRRTQYLFPEVM